MLTIWLLSRKCPVMLDTGFVDPDACRSENFIQNRQECNDNIFSNLRATRHFQHLNSSIIFPSFPIHRSFELYDATLWHSDRAVPRVLKNSRGRDTATPRSNVDFTKPESPCSSSFEKKKQRDIIIRSAKPRSNFPSNGELKGKREKRMERVFSSFHFVTDFRPTSRMQSFSRHRFIVGIAERNCASVWRLTNCTIGVAQWLDLLPRSQLIIAANGETCCNRLKWPNVPISSPLESVYFSSVFSVSFLFRWATGNQLVVSRWLGFISRYYQSSSEYVTLNTFQLLEHSHFQ